MKFKFVFVLLFLLVVFVLRPESLPGEIKDTAHDFSGKSWSKGELCLVCHVSHNTESIFLWNHKISAANYQLYDNPDGSAPDQPGPANVSRLCLSCHDGTVAIDSFGNNPGTEFLASGNRAYLGTHLKGRHHPAMVDYPKTRVWHLKDPSSSSGLGKTLEQDLLKNGKVECTSCHNVHSNNKRALILPESNLCAVCHQM